MRQESHRVYLQTFAPRSAATVAGTSLGGGSVGGTSSAAASLASGSTPRPQQHGTRPILTASAAIRLTDGATARDVTKLLRAKFGWPPLRTQESPPAASPVKKIAEGGGGRGGNPALSRINARLAEFRGDEEKAADDGEDDDGPPIRTIAVAASPPRSVASTSNAPDGEAVPETECDALVLVGTITGLPKNYVRFEHEPEEDDGVLERSTGSDGKVATWVKNAPNLMDESGSYGWFEKAADSREGAKVDEVAKEGGEKHVTLEYSDILEMHEGNPERKRMGSKGSLASAATVKASGACRQISDGSTLDTSLSTRIGLDLSNSQKSQGVRAGVTELDTSCYRPGPQPSSSLSVALATKDAKQEGQVSSPSTPTIRNGPQARHHRRTSSGDGLSTSRRNGEPVSSPSSSWTESLIGVPRGRVGTIVTEGQHGHENPSHRVTGIAEVSADAAALGALGTSGYAQGLDRPGPVDPVPHGRGHAHHGRHQTHRHHHRHHHHREEYATSPEPYNLIRTLKADENPLMVRDEVAQILGERQRCAEEECGVPPRRKRRAPAFRWFFQPCAGDGCGNSRIRNVPSCVDVEGYCSGTENSDDEGSCGSIDEENDDNGRDCGSVLDAQKSEHSDSDKQEFLPYWRTQILERYVSYHQYNKCRSGDDLAVGSVKHLEAQVSRPQRWPKSAASHLADERHRLTILSQREGSSEGGDGQCVSGYLLKRSRLDPNVWRRVHCVLTDDQLWYVTRVRPLDNESCLDEDSVEVGASTHRCPLTNPGRSLTSSPVDARPSLERKPKRIGRHRVVRLTRSLLVESDPASRDSTPLSRTPHAFEICTASGNTHVFRAMRRSVQRRWADCLGSRIVRGHEDNVMELADLIVAEETFARGRRMEEKAAPPELEGGISAWARMRRGGSGQGNFERCGTDDRCVAASEVLLNAVRFGAEVAEYHELCQRARAAIAVASLQSAGEVRSRHQQNGGLSANHHSREKEVVRRRQNLALAAWESAEDVLSKSHKIVRALRGSVLGASLDKQIGRSHQDAGDKIGAERDTQAFLDVESVQQQISDLVEEGRVQILVKDVPSPSETPSETGGLAHDGSQCRDSADNILPPIELFDVLLSILQRLSSDRADVITSSKKEE